MKRDPARVPIIKERATKLRGLFCRVGIAVAKIFPEHLFKISAPSMVAIDIQIRCGEYNIIFTTVLMNSP